MAQTLHFDEVGLWSEIKLEILKKYAQAYSTILSAQRGRFSHVYIDAFAGAGQHISKSTRDFIAGSPLNALAVEPPFQEFYLIDIKPEKIDNLRQLIGDRKDVRLLQGDCNEILLREVFPNVQYADYRRGLCVLDPYGLHLDWTAISMAGQMKSIDLFLNFPVQDMNRNVFWRNPDRVDESQIHRMNSGATNPGGMSYMTQAGIYLDFLKRSPMRLSPKHFGTGYRKLQVFGMYRSHYLCEIRLAQSCTTYFSPHKTTRPQRSRVRFSPNTGMNDGLRICN